ncbi:hypothetical protein Ae201684_013359, partial [Aphanomyces euteiches]
LNRCAIRISNRKHNTTSYFQLDNIQKQGRSPCKFHQVNTKTLSSPNRSPGSKSIDGPLRCILRCGGYLVQARLREIAFVVNAHFTAHDKSLG